MIRKIVNHQILLLFLLAFSVVAGIYWLYDGGSKSPMYSGIIERRDYEPLVLPLDGTTLEARIDRIRHRFNKPGQAKLIKRFTSSSPPKDLQSAFEEFGYEFPSGTEVVMARSTVYIFYIQHYPEVLDSLEAEFQLEQR